MQKLKLPSDWRERVREMLLTNGKRQTAESERRQIAEKLDRLKWVYVQGDLNQTEYKREKTALESRLAALTVPQEREVMNAGAYLENLGTVWNDATLAERREMVLTMLEQVVCDPEEQRIAALRPKPSFVLLFRQNPDLREHDGRFVLG
jgi:hypothetical protein